VIAYISIGNSDGKLTQAEWSDFVERMAVRIVAPLGSVHGAWFSVPWSPYQSACWCLEFPDDPDVLAEVRKVLAEIRDEFRQDSIAFAVAQTEFI